MTIIKFRSGSNQPCSEVSHLKKLTVEQVMRRCPSYQRHYFLIHDFLSYFIAYQFYRKAHARSTRNRQILRLRPKRIESNIFGDIAGNTFLKG